MQNSMQTFDFIIVGGGITGAALSYTLSKKGVSVLLLEKDQTLQNATRYSYGGLPFWSGTNDLTRQLLQEGVEYYRHLGAELDTDIQFRELDLLLTIPVGENPKKVADSYAHFAIPPRLINNQAACELEPLLSPWAIAGALMVRHGHFCPDSTNLGYCQAFTRQGGQIIYEQVIDLVKNGEQVTGVKTVNNIYHGHKIIICAGGITRNLLKSAGVNVPIYFSHAEMLEVSAEHKSIQMNTLVMPAIQQRKPYEKTAGSQENDHLWDIPGEQLAPISFDVGAAQFKCGKIRIGQISRFVSDVELEVSANASEQALRQAIGKILPPLENLPAQWYRCLIAFSRDGLPLIGEIPGSAGLHIFSGFTAPFAIVPPLATHFAHHLLEQPNQIIAQLSPTRFLS
jgi:glycine/D-amino acid oxidase-like deaminating enzyme